MLPKLICAAAIASGGAFAHSVQTRDTNPVYRKVNRDSEYGAPAAPAYNAPAPSYGAPAPSYAAPAPSYSAPAPSYAAPAPSYAEPSYEEPSASYGQPSYAADDGGGIDLTALIIPILALIGLSLLFPTYVSVASRKKRSLPDGTDVVDANPMTDVVERVNEIYNSVITSEQCMERIACELGGLASDVGLKESPMAKMADLFVTAKYKPYYKQFKSGQNCEKIKCGSLPF